MNLWIIPWYIGVFLFIVVVHELGHWLAFKYYKYNPSIRITWYGGIYLGENVSFWMTPKESYITYSAGILFGAVPAFLTHDSAIMIGYACACIIDISGIVQLLSIPKASFKSNKPLLVLAQDELIEYNAKYPNPHQKVKE